jgi:hypothetical protein
MLSTYLPPAWGTVRIRQSPRTGPWSTDGRAVLGAFHLSPSALPPDDPSGDFAGVVQGTRVPLGQAVHAHLTSPPAMPIHYSVGAEYSNYGSPTACNAEDG